MSLSVYNPSHPDASSGWVALTAAAPWPAGARTLHIRDTAFALSGASPNGVGQSETITLPGPARWAIFGATEENGTNQTAGALAIQWIPKDAVFTNAGSEPTANGATGTGIDASVVMTGTGDNNTYGMALVVPEAFKIRATGFTYTGSLSLISLHIQVQMAY